MEENLVCLLCSQYTEVRGMSRDDSGPLRAEGVGPHVARRLPALRGVPRHAVRQVLCQEQPAVLHRGLLQVSLYIGIEEIFLWILVS